MKWMTLLACSALVLGAIAAPAMADSDDDDKHASHDAKRAAMEEKRAEYQEKREDAKERQAEFRAAHDRCKEIYKAADARNASVGTDVSSDKNMGKCVKVAAHDDAHKARRAYHHIVKQIDAVEHRIAKLEVKEYRIEAKLDSSNLTANETAELEAMLERIDNAQGDLVEKLTDLYQKLRELKERWHDHKSDRPVRDYPGDAPATSDESEDAAPSGEVDDDSEFESDAEEQTDSDASDE